MEGRTRHRGTQGSRYDISRYLLDFLTALTVGFYSLVLKYTIFYIVTKFQSTSVVQFIFRGWKDCAHALSQTERERYPNQHASLFIERKVKFERGKIREELHIRAQQG